MSDTAFSGLAARSDCNLTDELLVSRPGAPAASRQQRMPVTLLRDRFGLHGKPSDFGVVGDGVADDTAGLQAWINATNGEAVLPAGHYRVDAGNINLTNVALRGCGVMDKAAPYSGSGTVIEVTGTTNPAFILGYGATVEGMSFFYPNQTEAANPPIAYPPLFSGPSASRVYVRNCAFVNPYIAFQFGGTNPGEVCGGIWISDCFGYAIFSAMNIKSCAETTTMHNCHWSYGWYQDVANAGPTHNLRDWTATHGEAIHIDAAGGAHPSVDGLKLSDCYFFGQRYGVRHVSGQVFDFQASSTDFDGVGTAHSIEGTAFSASTDYHGGLIYAYSVADPGAHAPAVLISATVSQGGSVKFNGTRFQESAGHHVEVDATSTGLTELLLQGCTFAGWGVAIPAGQDAFAVSINDAPIQATITGNSFLGLGSVQAVGISIVSTADVAILGNTFGTCSTPMAIHNVGRAVVVGCVTVNTSGAKSLNVDPAVTANVALGTNSFDKP